MSMRATMSGLLLDGSTATGAKSPPCYSLTKHSANNAVSPHAQVQRLGLASLRQYPRAQPGQQDSSALNHQKRPSTCSTGTRHQLFCWP
jgi:hypothetical protein